jgi:hypothetical protein
VERGEIEVVTSTLTLAEVLVHPYRHGNQATRGEAMGTSEARQMLEYAIEVGRGGVYLKLTPEQYARLKRS